MNAVEKVSSVGYDTDFYEWLQHQARLIREGQWSGLDRENLAEEVESLGRSELREVKSLVANILEHLCFVKCLPGHQDEPHWRKELRTFRRQLELVLEDSPSLRNKMVEQFDRCWQRARRDALDHVRTLQRQDLPDACPFTPNQMLAEHWYPTPG